MTEDGHVYPVSTEAASNEAWVRGYVTGQQELRSWLLERTNSPTLEDLIRRHEEMSLVQAETLKEYVLQGYPEDEVEGITE